MSTVRTLKDLNQSTLEGLLKAYLKENEIVVEEIQGDLQIGTTKVNFSSNVRSWKITYKVSNKAQSQIDLIVKSSYKTTFHKFASKFHRQFAKELFWFERALPTLSKICPELQSSCPAFVHGFSTYDGHLFKVRGVCNTSALLILKCLFIKPESGILILEDLTARESPLRMRDKEKVVTLQQARAVVTALARLHGSYLVWYHSKDKFDSCLITERDLQGLETIAPRWSRKGLVDKVKKAISTLLRKHNRQDLLVKWENYCANRLLERQIETGSTQFEQKATKIVTLCHGDAWTTNFMFNEDDSEVVLIDYQMMSLLHPARDLWYFMAIGTDADFRKAHQDDIFHCYFDTFSKFLAKTPVTMSFEEFKQEVLERRDILITITCDLLVMFLNADKIQLESMSALTKVDKLRKDVCEGNPNEAGDELSEILRSRLLGLVEEAAECEFI